MKSKNKNLPFSPLSFEWVETENSYICFPNKEFESRCRGGQQLLFLKDYQQQYLECPVLWVSLYCTQKRKKKRKRKSVDFFFFFGCEKSVWIKLPIINHFNLQIKKKTPHRIGGVTQICHLVFLLISTEFSKLDCIFQQDFDVGVF